MERRKGGSRWEGVERREGLEGGRDGGGGELEGGRTYIKGQTPSSVLSSHSPLH